MTETATWNNSSRPRPDGPGLIDTHCHLWDLGLAKQGGLTAEFGPIFRSFSPTDLSLVASPCRVNACVVIESGKTNDENLLLEQTAGSSSLIAAFLPYVDLANPNVERQLDAWRSNPKFRGVRARFEGHPDPEVLTRSEVLDGIARVAERGLILEFLVRAAHLEHIVKVYQQFPRLKAIIEHMAKPDVVDASDRNQWRSMMKRLASETSFTCKLSLSPRLEQISQLLRAPTKGWPVELIRPFVASLLEWFGSTRLMWGSDWPVALLMASYEDTLKAMRAAIGSIPPDEEVRLFGATAMEFYQL
jgi:L-fuconolactonase